MFFAELPRVRLGSQANVSS